MLKIRTMTEDDIEFAYSMTEFEDWGYLKDDFARLIHYDPEGCYVAVKDDEPVGIITSTTYDDRYAFIGSLIIKDEYRNQGIGAQMLTHTLDYLKSRNIGSIELDGVLKAVPLYRRFGFQDKYLSVRLKRAAYENAKAKIKPVEVDINDLAEFDQGATGLNRERMLEVYTATIPENIFIETDYDRIIGYAIVRPRSDGSYTIGPFVARTAKAASSVLGRIILGFGDKWLGVGIPMINHEAVELFRSFGFLHYPPSLRMYLGEKLDYEKELYGIFSAEKG